MVEIKVDIIDELFLVFTVGELVLYIKFCEFYLYFQLYEIEVDYITPSISSYSFTFFIV